MGSFMKEFEHLKIQLEEIKNATNSFGNEVIGKGGFGPVYKGEVSHSKGRNIVAIKRLDGRFGQGKPEFLKEIMVLSRYTHQNLISLLGYCDENGEKILVYEYASNESLDKHLSDPGLTWTQRLKICIGAAKGLSYLHDPNGTYQRVIHCDIKSANILLDESLNAKVADFGLAKFGPANQQDSFIVTDARGTHGYCDPSYMTTYTLTKESDIYSFGVVLFEVLCGKLCSLKRGDKLNVFVPMWKESYTKKKLEKIIFQDIKQQINPTSLKIFSDIAFQCLQDVKKRPRISLVVKNLELALECQESKMSISLPCASDNCSLKIPILCSFGGQISPIDGKLRYVGGETHIIGIEKDISWQEFWQTTQAFYNETSSIKYLLPDKDLESLVSVSSDKDLIKMMEVSNEMQATLRMFLFSLSESKDANFGLANSISGYDPSHVEVSESMLVDVNDDNAQSTEKGDVLADLNDRFPRDYLSDIFARVNMTEDSADAGVFPQDEPELSLNIANDEPKHWSYFMKLARDEFAHKDV